MSRRELPDRVGGPVPAGQPTHALRIGVEVLQLLSALAWVAAAFLYELGVGLQEPIVALRAAWGR